jgi:site-specific recombinase XerD
MEFKQFLIIQNKANSTINRIVSNFALMVKNAKRDGYLKDNPCEHITKLPQNEPEKIFLMMEELNTWMEFPLASQKMKAYRDMFTWLCLTGMYLADLRAFHEQHFTRVQGELFIDTEREKNGSRFVLRVHPKVNELWEQYHGLWPKISGQKFNRNLQQLAEMMGIDKILTMKSGRKTFANYMESKGIEPQRIADMMGHKHFSMTRKHYSKVQLEGVYEATKHLYEAKVA